MNQKKNEESGKLALPVNKLKIEAQLSVLKSLVDWYDKNKKPVTYKDIGGVHASKTNVSATLGYFSNVGWLRREGRGKYVPSEELVQYFMGFNKELGAQKLASKVLSSPLGQRLNFFLEQRGKASEEDTISDIGGHFDLKQKDRQRIQRIIDLLVEFGALEKTEEGISFKKDQKKPPVQPQNRGEQGTGEKDTKEIDILKREKVQTSVVLGILIDANAPEEKIRRAVRIVKEEIEKGGV
ncbi:MAG: hypothetical protein JRI31_12015 [Deltaproteobacteria bacterium]|nr:hypothetical protein [Deltaproteobacteria bacterium]